MSAGADYIEYVPGDCSTMPFMQELCSAPLPYSYQDAVAVGDACVYYFQGYDATWDMTYSHPQSAWARQNGVFTGETCTYQNKCAISAEGKDLLDLPLDRCVGSLDGVYAP